MKFLPSHLDQMIQRAERAFPAEACGFVLSAPNEPMRSDLVMVCANIQDELHAADPVRYPRTSATAYQMAPKDQEAAFKLAQKEARRVMAIFHSHPNHEVYFSAEDKAMACPWGEPLYPDMGYVVISVENGKFKDASVFVWHEETKDFLEEKLKVISKSP